MLLMLKAMQRLRQSVNNGWTSSVQHLSYQPFTGCVMWRNLSYHIHAQTSVRSGNKFSNPKFRFL